MLQQPQRLQSVSARIDCVMALPPISLDQKNESVKDARLLSKTSLATDSRVSTAMENISVQDVLSSDNESVGRSDVPTLGSLRNSITSDSEEHTCSVQAPRSPPGQHSFRRKAHQCIRSPTAQVPFQSLYDAICDVAPLAEVAYVGNRLQVDRVPQASSIVAYSVEDTCTYPERFKDAAVVAFIVEDEEESVQKLIEILRNKTGSTAGLANVFLVGQPLNIDCVKLSANISSLMEVGADDVVVVPSDSSQLKRVISVSLAKAKTCKEQTDRLRRKLAASRTQCQRLFWDVAHEVLHGMPQLREGLHEAHEKSVGNIQFICRAGKGSYSDVYVCRNASKEKTCVAKVFNKQEIRSIDKLCEIVLEHDILRKLKHPNIIEAINLVHGPQNMYLFTEWVGASNLFQTINSASEQGLFWTQAKDLMLDIFAAAAYMHDMKVAHCDLKPENIVVSSEGNAKLIDFGQAVPVDEDIPGLKNPRGTFPFMAREIMLCSKTWDPIAADMWSLGVIQIEMCCGNHSFTQILGWKCSLTSLLEIQNCADELLIAFENQSKEALLDRVVERCRSELPRFALAFLSGLLEIYPENRLPAKNVLAVLEDHR